MLALFRAVGKTCMSFRHSCNTIEMVLQLNVFSATVESVSVSCADHLLAKRRATFPPSATLPKYYPNGTFRMWSLEPLCGWSF